MTDAVVAMQSAIEFLLTRPSRDVTGVVNEAKELGIISTHTSLAGRDRIRRDRKCGEADFYSHVPRGT